MAIVPLQLARVSNYLRSQSSLSSIAANQRNLLTVQNQLATGVRFSAASEDPGDATVAIQLKRTLERRQAYADNISSAKSRLSLADSTLGDVTELMQRVQQLASSNVGSDVSASERASSATVVRSMFSQMMSLANRTSGGMYLFAGDKGGQQPYIDKNGGVQFVGSSNVLRNTVDDGVTTPISVDGARVFGGTSTRVQGGDISPSLSASTRIADLRGALGNGVRLGQVEVTTGAGSRIVDLSQADTVGDVMNALTSTGLVTTSISIDRLVVTPPGGQDLTIKEVGGNSTARDLGIERTTGFGPGVAVTGTPVKPKVTLLTPISALRAGSGLTLSPGITINSQTTSTPVSFAGVTNVQQLLNAINSSGAGALARINDAGTGIDIVNPTQGTMLSIAESGGTLATQLGVRSFTPATPLSQLNEGRGVQTAAGADLRITSKAGVNFDVDIDGAVTVQDVIDRINTAGNPTIGATFTGTGNAILITDASGGAGPLTVVSLNVTTAAADLGIAGTSAGTSLFGKDVNPVRTAGVFDNLLRLAAALESSDQREITLAAEGLKADLTRIVSVRGDNGAKVKELEDRESSLSDANLATETLLSEIRDTDYPTAITRFQLLQTTLQANYQTTAQLSRLSLMDFLR
jgi:flagellar hook-associated protein 3 FlgL